MGPPRLAPSASIRRPGPPRRDVALLAVSRTDEAAGPWVEPEEAPAGLLLLPPESPGPGFADGLEAVLATGAVVAFLAAGPATAEAAAWRERCRRAGVAFLAHGGPDLARALGADGVHLGDPSAVADARRRLGPDALIGADCGGSRHAAMVAGEEGADYVVFGAVPPAAVAELCAWWAELFVVPCAASVRGESEADALVRAGADFLVAREAVWGGPAGPAAAAAGLLRRMEAARAQRHQGSP
jgi:thiamine-phosphate pyrophosphorylase